MERLYRRLAREEVARRLDGAVEQVGSSLQRPSIRAQSTRWASCSAKGAMSFNWRLLLAPEPVLDYVVWHEVCHLEILRPLAALLGAPREPLPRLARAA